MDGDSIGRGESKESGERDGNQDKKGGDGSVSGCDSNGGGKSTHSGFTNNSGLSSSGGSSGGVAPIVSPQAIDTPFEITPVESPDETVNPFFDVTPADWFYDDVMYAYLNNLFRGTSETQFNPYMAMNRGMLVTILGRLHNASVENYSDSNFTDVSPFQYYAPYIEWARENGMVMGIGDNKFAPDEPISRQDLAVIIMRYFAFASIDIPATQTSTDFVDYDQIEEYARDVVDYIVSAGIMYGRTDNIFDIGGNVSRAEVAAVLHRVIEKQNPSDAEKREEMA